MILLKLSIMGASAILNFWGGKHWLWCRRFVMSSTIALFFAITLKTWWLFPLIFFPFWGALTLPNHNRGLWCGAVSIGASAALFFLGHMHLCFLISYVLGNAFLGWFMNDKLKADEYKNDVSEGLGFSSEVFLVN